ncbi:ketoacyl-ACP synthase III family protein [Streptomyces olivaceoviridis]|uniref:ketoacyl-ACP synthase III family protein n=1 Tax=Streptomyces olivaceoviridis TaxID=1921 RepID=UPI0036F5A297
MKWDGVYVNGGAIRLGRREDVRDAVADGRYDAEECERNGYSSVCVADGAAPPEMAVAAGRRAVERSGVPQDAFDLVLHASMNYQGMDAWTPSPYNQAGTVGGSACSVDIHQLCNGGLVGLQMAAAHLSARPAGAALVTTADAFPLPAVDRFRSDMGAVFGDGASAVVLSRTPGPARLLSTALVTDTTHEAMSRGEVPWSEYSGELGFPWDLSGRRIAYLRHRGIGRKVVANVTDGMAGVSTPPSANPASVSAQWPGSSSPTSARRTATTGTSRRTTAWSAPGPPGTGDAPTGTSARGTHLPGVVHLLETGAVQPGDHVALVGLVAGFSFGCAVVQIEECPDWEPEESR